MESGELAGIHYGAHAEHHSGINSLDSALKAEDILANLDLKRLCQTCFGNAFMNVMPALAAWIKSDSELGYSHTQCTHTHTHTHCRDVLWAGGVLERKLHKNRIVSPKWQPTNK